MSNAVCERCKVILRWSASRGTRLADLLCPCCGGKLRAIKWDEWRSAHPTRPDLRQWDGRGQCLKHQRAQVNVFEVSY